MLYLAPTFTKNDLLILRNTIVNSPDPRQGYSSEETELLDVICDEMDRALGNFLKQMRRAAAHYESECRAARLKYAQDRTDLEFAYQLAADRRDMAIEPLIETDGAEVVTLRLEEPEFNWLAANFNQRTGWSGADVVRAAIRRIRAALKDAPRLTLNASGELVPVSGGNS